MATQYLSPIADSETRPLWTTCIPAGRERGYLVHAIKSAIDQGLPQTQHQIIVSDDSAAEGDARHAVRDVVATFGDRVEYHHNPLRLGLYQNTNACLRLSRGHLVHVLHDDDVLDPGFIRHMGCLLDRYPHVGAGFCRAAAIDTIGDVLYQTPAWNNTPQPVEHWQQFLIAANGVPFPAHVVRRDVFEALGLFETHGNCFSADWTQWVKIASCYAIAHTPLVLVGYRVHDQSTTTTMEREGTRAEGEVQAVNRIAEIIPPTEENKQLLRAARHAIAQRSLTYALRFMAAGSFDRAQKMAALALEICPSLELLTASN